MDEDWKNVTRMARLRMSWHDDEFEEGEKLNLGVENRGRRAAHDAFSWTLEGNVVRGNRYDNRRIILAQGNTVMQACGIVGSQLMPVNADEKSGYFV